MYSPKIVTDGIVLCLDAGNVKSYPKTGTTWTDLCGNGNTGTLTNGPTFSATNGGSIVFDGVDDKVTFPNNTLATTSGVTAEVWFNTSSGTKYQDIFDVADAYGVWIVTNFSGAGSGKLVTSFNTTSGYISSNYTANKWYQVVLAGSGTSNYQYVNGALTGVGSQTVPTSINLNTARLGNVDGDRAAEYFIGNIASLKIYNRALSATDVLQNYNATKARYGL